MGFDGFWWVLFDFKMVLEQNFYFFFSLWHDYAELRIQWTSVTVRWWFLHTRDALATNASGRLLYSRIFCCVKPQNADCLNFRSEEVVVFSIIGHEKSGNNAKRRFLTGVRFILPNQISISRGMPHSGCPIQGAGQNMTRITVHTFNFDKISITSNSTIIIELKKFN